MAMPLVPVVLGLLGAAALAKGVLDPRITLLGKATKDQLPAEMRRRYEKANPFIGFYRMDAPEGELQLQVVSTEGESAAQAALQTWYTRWKKAGKPMTPPMPIYLKSGGAEYFGPFTDDGDEGTIVVPMMFVPKKA